MKGQVIDYDVGFSTPPRFMYRMNLDVRLPVNPMCFCFGLLFFYPKS